METWRRTAERRARSAQSAQNERSTAKSNSTTNSRSSGSGSTNSQRKKRKRGLTLKSSYMPGSKEEEFEDGDEEERDQAQDSGAQDREVIDLVTPSPPPALAALQSSSSSDTASGISSEQQTTQPTSLNTTESSGNSSSSSSSSSRPRKKAKLVLHASYIPSTSPTDTSDSEDNTLLNANFDALYTAYGPSLRPPHPNPTSTNTADEEELEYLFNAEFDKLTDEDENEDAEGTYESSPPLDNTPYATALSVEKHPQVFEIADMVHACNGCCLTQDVVVPSVEGPGAVDRQGAVHELMEYLFDAAYEETQPGEYVKWEVEVFVHDNDGCCEGDNGEDDCGDLTGTLDISSTQSVHFGTLASVSPDWENPDRRNEETEYLFERSAWMEVNLRASMEEIRWVEAEDGEEDMVVSEGEEGFELAKQKARAALLGWVKEESVGVVVFIDGRDVKVFVKSEENGLKRKRGDTDEEDSDDEIEEMSPEEFKRAGEEKAAAEKEKQMDEIHAHMRDYEARMKASLVDKEGKPLFYRDGK